MAEQETPYVVLLGKVGSGKSTIVQKVTGKTERASRAGESATKVSEPLWTLQGELVISDTPGINAFDKFNHNIWIAAAFNFRPVSKIFIVVEAGVGRIESVIEGIREYSDPFISLPGVPLGVLLTHMDRIQWDASENGFEFDLREAIKKETEIDDVLFSSPPTDGRSIIIKMRNMCKETFNLRVDHENFLRLFKNLHKMRPTKVLQKCQREVEEFSKKSNAFGNERRQFSEREQVDLVFEFQAFMTKEITRAQMRLSDEFNFTFLGPEADNEAAHIQNMSNHMILELRKIRIEALDAQSSHGVAALRKCPHCGEVWTKVEGCDDETYCGTRPSTLNDLRGADYAVMSTFTFGWNETSKKMTISKTGKKQVQKLGAEGDPRIAGCGNPIVWRDMAPVEVPVEFNPTVAAVSTLDVNILPPSASNFNESLDDRLKSHLQEMTLEQRP